MSERKEIALYTLSVVSCLERINREAEWYLRDKIDAETFADHVVDWLSQLGEIKLPPLPR